MTAESSGTNDPSQGQDAPVSPVGSRFPEIQGFRIIQELGRSPKGVVYKARRLVEQDVVAAKVYRDSTAREPRFREILQRNAEGSFLLEHPALVRSLGCHETDGRLLLVMEYARGEPLSRALQRNVRFLPPRALGIAFQCASALRYAHDRNRYHGRLHPGDLILGDEAVRVLGVGLGERPEHAAWQVKDPHLFEPLIYVAPEAMPSMDSPTDHEARRAMDLYALGGILYHMLTGTSPFRGADESTITQERNAIVPAPVRWPRGTEHDLPPRAVALVERLLSANPAERGDYDGLMPALEEAIQEAEGQPMPPPKRVAPMPVLPPAEVAPRPGTQPAGTPQPASHSSSKAMLAPRRPRPQPYGAIPAPYYGERRGERFSTALLIGAVVFVFGFASGLAVKTFLFSPAAPTGSAEPDSTEQKKPAVTAKEEPRATAPRTEPVQPERKPARMTDEETRAERRLALAQEMLETGEAQWNRNMLRVLRDIMDEAGPSTRTELRARLLMAEVEDRLARAGGKVNAAKAKARTPTDAEDKVFGDHVSRARELVVQKRFGAAIEHLRALPESLKMAPFTERVDTEVTSVEQSAKAAFAETAAQAEKALAAGDFAKARALYQNVQARYGIAKWTDAAAVRLKRIQSDETLARDAKAKASAERKTLVALKAFSKVLTRVIPDSASFKYDEARAAVDRFATDTTDPAVKKWANEYAKLIRDEKWFFERCRTRLKEEIETKGASPLQVYNAKKKGAPGLDIIDFDEQGLTFAVKRGGSQGTRKRDWETINPKQPYNMLQLLMDKANEQEQRALAMMAFHRAARSTHAASDKGLSKETAAGIRRKAADFRTMTEDALRAAVQADPTSRGKVDEQRKLLDRIIQLLSEPPEVPE